MSLWLERLAAETLRRRGRIADRPFLIGLAGAVASGKSAVAERLAERLRAENLDVEIVQADGFLFPNAELIRRGLMDRKGFPDSYDSDRLGGFLAQARAGAARLTAPTYSHEAYDVAGERSLDRPDVLIFEGLIALSEAAGPLDLALYIDADEDDLIAWYTERFMRLDRWKAPRLADRLKAVGGDPRALARDIWSRINAPNLRDHIAPTRDRADVVLRKGRDHSIRLAPGPGRSA